MNNTILFCLLFTCSNLYSQSDILYSFRHEDGVVELVHLNPSDASYSVVMEYEEFTHVIITTSSLNEIDNEFTFRSEIEDDVFRLYTIDIFTGAIKYNPPIIDIVYEMQHSVTQNKIFGFWKDGELINLVSLNKETAEKTIIQSYPGIKSISFASSGVDEINDHLICSGKNTSDNLQRYIIDLATGDIINSFELLGETPDFKFNCNDGFFYGLTGDGGVFYFSRLDPTDGSIFYINAIPEIAAIMVPTAVILPNENLYVLKGLADVEIGDEYLYTIDLLSGSLISSVPCDDSFLEMDAFSGCESVNINDNAPNIENEIVIFPNPANTFVEVDISISKGFTFAYQIINNLGEIVLQKSNLNSDNFFINTTDLASGLYYIVISQGDLIQSSIFMKN